MVMWFKVLVLSNSCGPEYIRGIRPALKMTFSVSLWRSDAVTRVILACWLVSYLCVLLRKACGKVSLSYTHTPYYTVWFHYLCLFCRPVNSAGWSGICSLQPCLPDTNTLLLMRLQNRLHSPPLQTINIVLFISWTPRLQRACIFHCDNP